MSLIKNASPQAIFLGADDKSTRQIRPSSDPTPQHCPLFYIFTRKGTTKKQLIGASKFKVLYGDETFDANDKYFNHATRFLQDIGSTGNICMVQRVVPEDAGVRSNANIYIDVLETNIPNYLRNSLGDYITDAVTGKPVVDPDKPEIPGFKYRFVKEVVDAESDFGLLRSKTGTMSEETTYVPPIKENVQVKLSKWTPIIKTGDELPIYNILSFTKSLMRKKNPRAVNVDYEIKSSNDNIVGLDATTLKYIAKGAGKADITIRCYDARTDVEASELKGEITLELSVTVQDTDVLPAHDYTVDGIEQILTDVKTGMQLTISNPDAVITVSDTSVLQLDQTTKLITGIANGQATVTVTVPADTTNGETQYIFTVQSKVIPSAPVTDIKTSTMYPLFEAKAKYQGEYYNNIGFSIGSLFNEAADSKIMAETKSLPYKLALYNRTSELSSPVILRSLFGEPAVNFSFKEKAINPNNDARMDFEHIFSTNWYNETDQLKTLRYFDYENIHFYRNMFELVTSKFLARESEFITSIPVMWEDKEFASTLSWFDFTTDDADAIMEENYLLNIFACRSTKNIKYFSIMPSDLPSTFKDNQSEITLTSDTPIFLDGGSDGTLSNENFEKLVVGKMNEYIDGDSEVQDLAINVESVFYDTGFTLDTKKVLPNFITLRKDTFLGFSTHDDSLGNKDLPLSEARGVAIALKTKLKLAPESEYFGTSVCRGIVVLGTMELRGGDDRRIPLLYEIAMKSAKMMGAGTGLWKASELFDRYPGNRLEYGINPRPEFIPAGIKPTLWSDGVVWAQPFDRTQYHFPAIQTVYDNDTSALNGYFCACALAQLTKAGHRAWVNFTGTSSMTNAQFIAAVEEFINNDLKDRFGGVVTVIPQVEITEEDEQRGYSWRVVFKLYSPNLKSVMVSHSEVFRSSDLEK